MRDLYPRSNRAEVEELVHDLAYVLSFKGFTLRSGRADNSDQRFEKGHLSARHDGSPSPMEIYLPGHKFGGVIADGNEYINAQTLPDSVREQARELTRTLHPAPTKLGNFGMNAMDRNANQVLGRDLKSPVNFVVFAAFNSQMDSAGNIYDCKGGTGQAVRIAYKYSIPTFNVLHPPHFDRLAKFVKTHHPKLKNQKVDNDSQYSP